MKRPLPPVLLAARYKKPDRPMRFVSRQELLRRLDSYAHSSVTAVCTPAGCGKTQLLALWASGRKGVCWLSLGPDANSPVRFYEYLMASVAEEHPSFPREELRRHIAEDHVFLNQLINAISELPGENALIIDDIHCIDNKELFRSLRYLCLNLPSNLRLVLAGRGKLPFSLAKLAAQERFHSIGKEELALSAEDIAGLADARGIALSPREAEMVRLRTEGWAAGASLILAVAAKAGIAEALNQAGQADSLISEYFTDELLSGLSPQVREFLSCAAVLPYITPEACGCLLEGIGRESARCEEYLRQLWRDNLLVDRLPNGAYKLHQLLREVLLSKLRLEDPALYSSLCAGAARWYEQEGAYAVAMDIIFSAKDHVRAAGFIERNYSRMVMDGEVYLLNLWLNKLPQDIVQASAKLQLAKAWAHFPSGDAIQAEKHLSNATKQLLGGEDDSIVSCEIAALRALNYAMLRFDSKDSLRYSQEALRIIEGSSNAPLEMSTWLSGGVANLLQGEPRQAEAAFSKILSSPQNAQNLFLSFFSRYYFGVLEQKRGRLRRSAGYFSDAIAISRNEQGKERSIASLAHISLARIYYEWNRIEDCLRHVQVGLDLAGEWSIPSNIVNAYHTLSLVNRLKGDMQAALDAARQSHDFSHGNPFTPYITHEALPSLRQKVASPGMESSISWAGDYLLDLKKTGAIQGDELWRAPAALWLSAAIGDFQHTDGMLEALLQSANSAGFHQQVIEAQILRALLFQEQGITDKALMALANALEFAQYEGYMRMFLDEGEPMRALLEEAKSHNIAPGYTDKLLWAFEEPEANKPPAPPGCPLTARELEVLQALAEGKSPRQIAEALFISVGTTRCHLHNIYEKLGAANQLQAIHIAREQKWI